MALSGYPETTPLQLLLFSLLLLLLAGSAVALPARPAMDRARWQVDRVNRRGPSLGLVMSYVDEATALQASGYFTPWRVLPFVDLYGNLSRPFVHSRAYYYLLFRSTCGHLLVCLETHACLPDSLFLPLTFLVTFPSAITW
jgi:hypothetical protein